MITLKVLSFFLFGVLLHNAMIIHAKPVDCGGCVSPCDGLGYGGGFGSGYGGCFGSAPISFAPVPQPIPIRIPAPRPQSVTIPNIILALLPPNNKPVCRPPPIIRPPPVVLPLPQPYPLPIRDCGYDYGCESGCGC